MKEVAIEYNRCDLYHRAMRKTVLFVLAIAVSAHAQTFLLDLPLKSQEAEVSQRIGLTTITVRYHRPLVNGRKIWGELVPYGKVWRTGANLNTTIRLTPAFFAALTRLAAPSTLVAW